MSSSFFLFISLSLFEFLYSNIATLKTENAVIPKEAAGEAAVVVGDEFLLIIVGADNGGEATHETGVDELIEAREGELGAKFGA